MAEPVLPILLLVLAGACVSVYYLGAANPHSPSLIDALRSPITVPQAKPVGLKPPPIILEIALLLCSERLYNQNQKLNGILLMEQSPFN